MSQTSGRSRVFFWDFGAVRRSSHETKLRALLKAARVGAHLRSKDLAAIKTHFGEEGNTSFISPLWLGPILGFLRKCGARPFLTDTTTLYGGSRGNGVSHALLAREHGFDAALLQAPVLIADGIRGTNQVEVPGRGRHFRSCYLAGEIAQADAMLTCNHFTGHHLGGFAGALKNLAMGCASRRGKMQQHCTTGPVLRADKCRGCGDCAATCPASALFLQEDGTPRLLSERCTGCAKCLAVCPEEALRPNWDSGGRDFLERMAEYAAAAQSVFRSPVLHINFLLNITPGCDCEGHAARALCPDIGITASYDPVALDQAGLDLVNRAQWTLPAAEEGTSPSPMTLERLHPGTEGEHLLSCAESLGVGSRAYTMSSV
jgi:hypothetical protein